MRGRKWRMGGNAKNFNNRVRLPPPELRLYRVRKALRKFASYAFLHARASVCPRTLGAIFTGLPPLYSRPRTQVSDKPDVS